MKENKITEEIFDLVSSKPFETLSEEEKVLVLAEITEEEYRNTYELFQSASGMAGHNPVLPSAGIKQELLSAYDRKYPRRKPAIAFLFARVPVYGAAAAVLFAIMGMAMWHHFNRLSSSPEINIVKEQKTDTIYILADTTKVDSQDNVQSPAGVAHHESNGSNGTLVPDNDGADIKTLSRSIKKDSGLKQFMVSSL